MRVVHAKEQIPKSFDNICSISDNMSLKLNQLTLNKLRGEELRRHSAALPVQYDKVTII